jgi:Ca2+-transporting ATPase
VKDSISDRLDPAEDSLLPARVPWHVQAPVAILELLGVDPRSGLDPEEARKRLTAFGHNRIRDIGRPNPFRIIANQFRDFTIWVLIASAFIAGFLGEPQDIAAILAIVLLNGALGFAQEFRAEKAIAALKSLAIPHAAVRRGGSRTDVPTSELVPGDIVWIEAGNRVPADLRLLELTKLEIDESPLTGESRPVGKVSETLDEPELFLGDRRNMAFTGTLVTNGHGLGVVVATGMETELGRIASLLHVRVDRRTPLESHLDRFGREISLGVLGLCAILFFVGIARHEKPIPMFLTALSLAVAAIPEALPVVVKITLSLGARKMARNNVLVRALSAVETLGSVTTICTDKTGTLTQNRMNAGLIIPFDGEGVRKSQVIMAHLFEAMALNNDVSVERNGTLKGDPTEIALLVAAGKSGFPKDRTEANMPRIAEIPFSTDRNRMSTIHERPEGRILFSKGAPERILEVCNDPKLESSKDTRDAILGEVRRMASDGLRVLAFAYTDTPETIRRILDSGKEENLTFLGLVGLEDPPRPEAADAVRTCREAGIRVVMITGDHPETAGSIARRLGILDGSENDILLTGKELERLSMDEYETCVQDIRVYARVSPEEKLKIVTALKNRGECVAMTGDGINDAPALQRSDIGIAMGLSGTDVAREASHMILLDDNFASIVSAVKEGRRIYDNIRKFVRYVLTGNAGEIGTILLAPVLGLPMPLLPIQILWVNLVTDGLPGIALAVEPEERDTLLRPPRPREEGIVSMGMVAHISAMGLLIASLTLLSQYWALRTGSPHWQSMTFTVLTLSQMFHILSIRIERETTLGRNFFTNRVLIGSVGLTILLQTAILYSPVLNRVFRTHPLTGTELVASIILSSLLFPAVEIEKWIRRKVRARYVFGGRDDSKTTT